MGRRIFVFLQIFSSFRAVLTSIRIFHDSIEVQELAPQYHQNETEEVKLGGVLSEFRTALQEEIQAARVFESSNAVELKNGRRIAKVGKNFQYLFEIENALNLPGDTPGDLLIPGNPPISVIIVSIEGLAITISIDGGKSIGLRFRQRCV